MVVIALSDHEETIRQRVSSPIQRSNLILRRGRGIQMLGQCYTVISALGLAAAANPGHCRTFEGGGGPVKVLEYLKMGVRTEEVGRRGA